MFERVQFEEWQTLVTIAAFFLCFSAFVFFCWRAIRMGSKETKHLSGLPLESDNVTEKSSHD